MNAYSQRRITLVLLLIMTAGFCGSVLLLNAIDHQRSSSAGADALYISSPQVLRRISLGYTGLMADIYWTRAIQYFGWNHQQGSTNYDLLYPLLDITTTLDPNLKVAYQFGAQFLAPAPPEGAGHPEQAIALLDKGLATDPSDWRLYYDMGFVEYMQKHDYKTASETFLRGSQLPNAHPALKALAAMTASKAGDVETATLMWRTTYETTQDRMVRENALKHLVALQSDQNVRQLQQIVDAYAQRAGHNPTMRELVDAGILRGYPADPTGKLYRIVDGRVLVQDPKSLPFITQGLPRGSGKS